MSKAPHQQIAHLQKAAFGTQKPEQDARMLLTNITRGTSLADYLEVATTSARRSKGLLGRDSLPSGGGLWIAPCESVHTFFMRFPIDLVYVDRALRVKKVRDSVRPWRISACLSAYSIIELPAGVVRKTGTKPGDQLEMAPVNGPATTSLTAS